MSNQFILADSLESLRDLELSSERIAFFARLERENKAHHDEVLCAVFSVQAYHVGTSCFASVAPESDHNKYFLATDVGSICDLLKPEGVKEHFESEEAAYAAAVEHFGLVQLFKDRERTLADNSLAYV